MPRTNRPVSASLFAVLLGSTLAAAHMPQQSKPAAGHAPTVLSLNIKDNGGNVNATVGQRIEITLGIVGPRHYGDPHLSSPAIRFRNTAQHWPVNPGGPIVTYIFEAVAEGTTEIAIPLVSAEPDDPVIPRLNFAVTIHVRAGGGRRDPREATSAPGDAGAVVSLDFKNNGQDVSVAVGQQIEITLGIVGPRHYGDPQVSSRTVRFENTALHWPPNPGGATVTYIFEAMSEGITQIVVPVVQPKGDASLPDASAPNFAVNIYTHAVPQNQKPPEPLGTPDQANTAPWQGGWTVLTNALRQSFTPSLPRLTAVEVELVEGNPGPLSADVSLTVEDAGGTPLNYLLSKDVAVTEAGHVLFRFPNGGLRVVPGQHYRIRLSDPTGTFGWKYVAGGYTKGAGSMNGKPWAGGRITFLFRTFGTN